MNRREQWRPVLETEVKKWSGKSCDELVAALLDVRAYEVEFDGERYQVEVQLLESTDKYVRVCGRRRRQSSCVVPSSEQELHTREAKPLEQGKTVS